MQKNKIIIVVLGKLRKAFERSENSINNSTKYQEKCDEYHTESMKTWATQAMLYKGYEGWYELNELFVLGMNSKGQVQIKDNESLQVPERLLFTNVLPFASISYIIKNNLRTVPIAHSI